MDVDDYEKGHKKGHSFIKWTTLSTFSANSSLHFIGMKFRERHSLSMFCIEFSIFRISVPEFPKVFWSSAAELVLFWLVHWHCRTITMYFFKEVVEIFFLHFHAIRVIKTLSNSHSWKPWDISTYLKDLPVWKFLCHERGIVGEKRTCGSPRYYQFKLKCIMK